MEGERERLSFVEGLGLEWEGVGGEERRGLGLGLGERAAGREGEEANWWKVEWGRVPELVEGRRVVLRGGWAYVPGREMGSLVLGEFGAGLEKAMEVRRYTFPALAFLFFLSFLSPRNERRGR